MPYTHDQLTKMFDAHSRSYEEGLKKIKEDDDQDTQDALAESITSYFQFVTATLNTKNKIFCKDCVHFSPTSGHTSSICNYHLDVVTGENSKNSAYAERSSRPHEHGDALCGPEGKFFQPIAKAAPSLPTLTSEQIAILDNQNCSRIMTTEDDRKKILEFLRSHYSQVSCLQKPVNRA